MTLHRISNSVSGQRATIILAASGVALCIAAVVAVFAATGRSDSQSSVGSPAITRVEVPSMPGVGVLSEREFVASAYAEHEAYMEALFGPYKRAGWTAPVDLALAKSEHEQLIDAVLQP